MAALKKIVILHPTTTSTTYTQRHNLFIFPKPISQILLQRRWLVMWPLLCNKLGIDLVTKCRAWSQCDNNALCDRLQSAEHGHNATTMSCVMSSKCRAWSQCDNNALCDVIKVQNMVTMRQCPLWRHQSAEHGHNATIPSCDVIKVQSMVTMRQYPVWRHQVGHIYVHHGSKRITNNSFIVKYLTVLLERDWHIPSSNLLRLNPTKRQTEFCNTCSWYWQAHGIPPPLVWLFCSL